MKRKTGLLCFAMLLLMVVAAPLAAAAPTVAQIDFAGRNRWSSYMAPCGNKIYYFHNYDIYSMNKNGSSKKKVYSMNNNAVYGMQAHGGYVYYANSDKQGIYRFKPGDSAPKLFISSASDFIIGGDLLYYATSNSKQIKYRNLSTGKTGTAVTTTSSYIRPQNYVQDMLIYSIGDTSTGIYNPASGKTTTYSGKYWQMQGRGSYVFYYNANNKAVYRAKLQSNGTLGSWSKFRALDAYDVVISGDYIYYLAQGDDDFEFYLHKQSIATGQGTRLGKWYFLYEPTLQPYGDYIWVFAGTDGALTGLDGPIGK